MFLLCQGIGCDLFNGLWYVTDLTIGPVHDNSLSCAGNVKFNSNLFKLKHLKSLSFFNCFVSSHQTPVTIPTQNWELLAHSLESLEFRSNPGLTGNIPVSIGELRNLQSLVITENGLTGEIPASIGNLASLKRLNLAGNLLTGYIPDNLKGLYNLLILDLSRNSLSGFLNSSLGGLSSLLKLDLSNNQFEGTIPEGIKSMKDLTLLDLSYNRLSGGLSKSLQEMSSLQELVLSNNPNIGGDLMSVQWQNLRGLTALDLSNTSLTGSIPESIADLKRLRFLGLHDNKLTGNISPKLETLPSVGAFYIHGNNLTGELKFSKKFYEKMGRRFGAWSNPNLCYSTGLTPASYTPFGVKLCEQDGVTRHEIHLDSRSKVDNGDWNSENNSSTGSVNVLSGIILLVEMFLVLVFVLL